MTSKNFVIWLRGFTAAANNFTLTPEQWDTLKDEVMKLSQERNLDFLNMVSTYKKVWDQHSD